MSATVHNFPASLLPRRIPRQKRSRLLVDSIKQACFQIMQRNPGTPPTALQISEVAGVTIGSIYQYFPTIDAVVASIYEDHMRSGAVQVEHLLMSRWLERPLQQVFKELAWGYVDVYGMCLAISPQFRKRYQQSFESLCWIHFGQREEDDELRQIVRCLLRAHRPHIVGMELTMKVQMATGILRGTLDQLLDTLPGMSKECKKSLCLCISEACMSAVDGTLDPAQPTHAAPEQSQRRRMQPSRCVSIHCS